MDPDAMCYESTFCFEYRECGHRDAQSFVEKCGLPKKAKKEGDDVCSGVLSSQYGRGGTQRVDGLCPSCTKAKKKAETEAKKKGKAVKSANSEASRA
jgi:hypothetical protein